MSIEAPPLERKLVAILAADVEGYSRLMHQNEEATLTTLTAHRGLVDSLIVASSGHITSTAGDSVLAEFASVVEAVKCGVGIQTALAAANAGLPAERQMHFRIGINVGDVMVKDGGIFGDGVNVAARVEALAPPGGICVTRGVRDHVRDRVDYGFEDVGDHSVKNIPRPVHVFRLIFEPSERATGVDSAVTLVAEQMPGTAFSDDDEVELTFWKSAEAGNRPAEYQAYLERYPAGAFATLAKARLAAPPAATGTATKESGVELIFWDSVKDSDDPLMFEAYLDKFPDGEFASLAEIRARALRR